jgi:post-segregation antitoxin (ccd killing protein)
MAAATTSPSAENSCVVSASYSSPTNDFFSVTKQLPAPSSSAPAQRVTYLSSLRKAAASIQESINKELTQRMEEDNKKAASDAASKNTRQGGIDEGKEEENYGEEVAEED